MLTAAATAAVATAKELLAQKLKTEPSPILPNPVQIAADPSVVPEESRQQCGGGAISTGSTISGGSGGGDGSGRSGRSSGKEHDNSSGVLRTGVDVANKETSAESRAAPTPVTVKDGSKQPKAATLDVKAVATKSGALESAKPTPPTIAPPMVRAQPFLIKSGDGLIMAAAATTEGERGQGRDEDEAEVDAVCDVGVVVVSVQDPDEEVKAAVGEAEVRVYTEVRKSLLWLFPIIFILRVLTKFSYNFTFVLLRRTTGVAA